MARSLQVGIVGILLLGAAFGLGSLDAVGPLASPEGVSFCPSRDPGPNAGWIRVPDDFWTVMEAVEVAVQQGLYRVWIGPGRYFVRWPDSPSTAPPNLGEILLCGLGPGFTVLLHPGLVDDYTPFDAHPPSIDPSFYVRPEEGQEALLEGFTLIGAKVTISAGKAARVVLRNVQILSPGGPQGPDPLGWDGITLYTVEEGAQVVLEGVTIQGAAQGIDISSSGKGEILLQDVLISGNEGEGLFLHGSTRTLLLRSRVVYNGSRGISMDMQPWLIIRDSEIAHNRYDGIDVGSGGLLEVYNTRIFANGGYGIRLFMEACEERWEASYPSFSGKIRGRGNEIFDNAQGDLCPEDYTWPEGFQQP